MQTNDAKAIYTYKPMLTGKSMRVLTFGDLQP